MPGKSVGVDRGSDHVRQQIAQLAAGRLETDRAGGGLHDLVVGCAIFDPHDVEDRDFEFSRRQRVGLSQRGEADRATIADLRRPARHVEKVLVICDAAFADRNRDSCLDGVLYPAACAFQSLGAADAVDDFADMDGPRDPHDLFREHRQRATRRLVKLAE